MIDIIKKYQNQLLLLFCLIIGLILRLHHIGLRTLWLDEASSANLLNYNFSQLYSKILATANQPAYIYLLKFWSYFFNNSELALRCFSTILGILSIFAIYKLGKHIFNKKTGLWAAFLLAINFFHIFYSIQARQYSLVVLLSILSYYYFIKNNNKKKLKYSLFYIIFTSIGFYSHPWFILLFGSQILYLLYYYFSLKIRINFKYCIKFFWPYLIITLLSLPWVVVMLNNNSDKGTWIEPVSFYTFIRTFNYFIFEQAVAYIIFTIFILFIIFFKEKNIASQTQINFNPEGFFSSLKRNKNKIEPILFYLFFPIISAWLISHFLLIYEAGRYEIIVLPAFIILISKLWSNLKNKKVIIVMVLILFSMSFRSVKNEKNNINNYSTNDRKETQILLDKINNNDYIIFTDLSRPSFDYYLFHLNKNAKKFIKISYPKEMEEHPAFKNVEKMMENKEGLNKEVDELIKNINKDNPKKIWVIYAYGNPVNEILLEKLNFNFNLISTRAPNENNLVYGLSIVPFHFNEILEYESK